MHRVFRVEAVSIDELGSIHATLAPSPDQPLFLRTHVADKARSCLPRDDGRSEFAKPCASLRADDQAVDWRKQQQQHGRVAGDCETEPLSKAVGDEVEIARPRARTFGLGALNVMLEGTP